MRLPALLFSDTHLTDNPADEYRWGLFPWLMKQVREHDVKTLVHLGDLTDAKDYHPAALVNRIVRTVVELSSNGVELVILMGNHDYLRSGYAYFQFLNQLPRVRYVTRPMDVEDEGKGPLAVALPHSREPMREWQGFDFTQHDIAFMHQTVRGARASNGQAMHGESLPALHARKVWSGDIHVPQVVGQVEYVGSPYHVRFGDDFNARCVLLPTRGAPIDLHYPTIKRVMIEAHGVDEVVLHACFLRPGDQAKVRMLIERADIHRWRSIEREVREVLNNGRVEVHDVQMRVDDSVSKVTRPGEPATGAVTDEGRVVDFVERLELGGDALDAGMEAM